MYIKVFIDSRRISMEYRMQKVAPTIKFKIQFDKMHLQPNMFNIGCPKTQ